MKTASLVMHVDGVSGAGKTTLLKQLAKKNPGLVVADTDDFSSLARKRLGITTKNMDPETWARLKKERVAVANEFLAKAKGKPVVFGGSGVEIDKINGSPTKVMLNTGPARATWRRFKRNALKDGPTGVPGRLSRIPVNYRKARAMHKDIPKKGYAPLSSDKIAELTKTLARTKKVKTAASRLRSMITFAKNQMGDDGLEYVMKFKDRPIGGMALENVGKDPKVALTNLDPEFQGMGLGKMMYGKALSDLKRLKSGHSVSDKAARAWSHLAKRHKVKKNPKTRRHEGLYGPADLAENSVYSAQFGKGKQASGLLAALGLGAASHVGTNLAVKALRSGHKSRLAPLRAASKKFHGFEKEQLGEGIRAGLEGTKRTKAARTRDLLVAPELSNPELLGRGVGGQLRGMSKGRRYKALKKLRKTIASNPELRESAEIGPLVGGINRALKKPLPKPMAKQKDTLADKATPYAAAAAATAVKPATAVHAGVNKARMLVARSKRGKKFFRDQALAGVMGEERSALRNQLEEALISPAVSDPRRASKTLAEFAKSKPREAARLATAMVAGGAKPAINKALRKKDALRALLPSAAKAEAGPSRGLAAGSPLPSLA